MKMKGREFSIEFVKKMDYKFFYKKPSCYGATVKNVLKVKQLAKQPSTLKH